MVHNTRSRNFCGTSTKISQQRTRMGPEQGQSNQPSQPHQSTPIADRTPLQHPVHSRERLLQHFFQLEEVNAIEELDAPAVDFSVINSSLVPPTQSALVSTLKLTKRGDGSFRRNLSAAIDEIVFLATTSRKKLRGVSLFAVKKLLHEDYKYNSVRTRKPATQYIVQCIKDGKYQQITGRGANGSFCLNADLKRQYKNPRSFDVTRNVSSQSVIIKRFKRRPTNVTTAVNIKL